LEDPANKIPLFDERLTVTTKFLGTRAIIIAFEILSWFR